MGGLLNSLGIDLLSALRPQSLIENSNLTVDGDGKVTVSATDYAGGFSGAMANAYAVNNTISATLPCLLTNPTPEDSPDSPPWDGAWNSARTIPRMHRC